MYAMSARPPDPELVGEGWRELWLERLENALPYAERWLSHQRRDDYWRCGSPCEDYAAIECAVYAVGGWADPYRQAVLDLLASLPGPRKGLIGPWAHRYPEEGTPGPAFDFRADCVRWWDRWLKGEENGVMDEPMLHAWMPEPARRGAPGRWVSEPTWPPLRPAGRGYALGEGTLSREPEAEAAVTVSSPESTGLDAGVPHPRRSSQAGAKRFAFRWRRSRTSSLPGIACGCPSARRTGPGSGRRPSGRRSGSSPGRPRGSTCRCALAAGTTRLRAACSLWIHPR
jgi:predicted acyl esterase